MNFNKHSNLEGQHAFLSPSNYHWINYDEQKLSDVYLKHLATLKGTELHDFACKAIRLGIKMPKSQKTLSLYINDAIGFKMTPEQPLYYSDNCFGTADSISFRQNFLRIHDLKSGETPASMHQLEVYAALFCLEYHISPSDIQIELRLYQTDKVLTHNPDPNYIRSLMDKIILFDKRIEKIKSEGGQ